MHPLLTMKIFNKDVWINWPLLLTLLVSTTIGLCDGLVKTWTANTNLNNPANWNTNRIPCSKDRPVIKDDVTVFLSKSLAFKEIVLPKTGQLIFGSDVSLAITRSPPETEQDNHCDGKGQDVIFLGLKTHDWYDPNNWNVTLTNNEIISPGSPSPIPDSETVPCPHDDVIFPPNNAFKLELEASSVTVRQLQINQKKYTAEEFNNLMQSPLGKQLFDTNANIKIDQRNCEDSTGCACGNDVSKVLVKICIHQEKRCPVFKCIDPIQPIGHCCKMCGSTLLIDYGKGFRFNLLKPVLDTYTEKPMFNGVKSYMSKTHDETIQIVLVDATAKTHKAAEMANALHKYLTEDMSGPGLYGIKRIQIQTSTLYNDSDYSEGIGAGGVIGILLLIMLLVACTVAGFAYFRKRRLSGFTFARFDTEGKIELELGTTPHDDLDPSTPIDAPAVMPSETTLTPDKGFDNPMYDTPQAASMQVLFSSPTKEVTESSTAIENPMFMVFEETDVLTKAK